MTTLTRALSLCLPMLAWTLPAKAETGPVELVNQVTDTLYELVNENRERYQEDQSGLEDAVREHLVPHIDEVYTARLVLGRQGRDLDQEQIREFAEALGELLITRYADGLLMFKHRDQVEILPLSGDNTERMTRVKTRIKLESGSRAPVDYVFRKTDDGWKVFDVIVEGISYVATFRNQIGEEIRRHGFDSTLQRLKSGELRIDVQSEDE